MDGANGGLSGALAQRLVDQVAASVAHNVNIMDADGIIIASLDAGRVGTLHIAAAEAARTRTIVRITEGDAVGTVRPGINSPIIMQGDVIGVVGVTGDPSEVAEASALLMLTLRLILEVESEHDARSTRDALARELLAALVADGVDVPGLRARSVAAGGELEAPFRLVVAFEPPREASAHAGAAAEARPPAAAARVLRAARSERERVAVADFDGLWMISGRGAIASAEGLIARILESGAAVLDSGALAEVGDLVDAARRCRALLRVPALLAPGVSVLRDLESEALVAKMDAASRRGLADRTVGALSSLQRATVSALVASGGSPQRASAQLGVHRNSLSARLEAISRTSGRDPREPAELQRLTLGLLAYRATYGR